MTDIAAEEINRLHELLKEDYYGLIDVGDEDGGFKTVARGDDGEGRWVSHEWVIVEAPSGNFYQWEWSRGLTENQDNEYSEYSKPFQVSKTVKLVEQTSWTKI